MATAFGMADETPAQPRRRIRWRKLITVGAVLTVLAGVTSVAGIASIFWWFGRDLAPIDLRALRRPAPQVTKVLARDGQLIGELFTERRTDVAYRDIPSHVENAFLAAEDADFYRHAGMDYLGMVRAMIANVRAGRVRQGASTITQQVVKNFILSPERTFERKVQELILARRLEQKIGKREILTLYLNGIYLGHGRYGVEEASQFYFGRSVADIDLGQAAVLAALPKAPGRDSPFMNPEVAKERQVYVLRQMVAKGFASPQEARRHIEAELNLRDRDEGPLVEGDAPEFVDAARAYLEERFGAEQLRTLGATVTTTVDLRLQRAAREAVRAGLVALDRRQGYGHRIKPVSDKRQKRARAKAEALKGPDVYPVVIRECPANAKLPKAGFCAWLGERSIFVAVPKGSRYDDPELSDAEQFPVGGITMAAIRTRGRPADLAEDWLFGVVGSGPEAAVVVAAPGSSEVLAMVGGAEYRAGSFNRVLQAKRQPGSAFKPFVYAAALASKRFTAATLVSDSPEIYEKWRPSNYEKDVFRGEIRVREALTHSVNTIAIKLLDSVGLESVVRLARAAGVDAPLAENLSLALGTSEVTPLDLLDGYVTLARGGAHREVSFIRSVTIERREAEVEDRPDSPAMGEDVAFVTTSLMQSVVRDGTARRARALKRPVAGKTGTSAEARDAWFAGFTPQRVAIAWVGYDRPRSIGRGETGGRAAIPIWLGAMESAHEGLPVAEFLPPQSVDVVAIDPESGLRVPHDWPAERPTLEEYFLRGTAPVETAPVEVAPPAQDALLDLFAGGGSDDLGVATSTGPGDRAQGGAPAPLGGAEIEPGTASQRPASGAGNGDGDGRPPPPEEAENQTPPPLGEDRSARLPDIRAPG